MNPSQRNGILNELQGTERIAKKVFGPEIHCHLPNRQTGIYRGPIVFQDANFYLQQITPARLVAHSTNAIDARLLNGQNCCIRYTNDKPSIVIQPERNRVRDLSRIR